MKIFRVRKSPLSNIISLGQAYSLKALFLVEGDGYLMEEGQFSELVSLSFMAIALGMDAFSVSLGLGLQKLRLRRIALICLVIGIFHVIMPFSGMLIGNALSAKIGQLTTLAGGLLLFGIGAQMFFSAFQEGGKSAFKPVGFGLILFAFTVSIDSFSVGLSLGISGVQTIVALILFSSASVLLTLLGLMLGRKVRGLLGKYSELIGGSILCGFGLFILFG